VTNVDATFIELTTRVAVLTEFVAIVLAVRVLTCNKNVSRDIDDKLLTPILIDESSYVKTVFLIFAYLILIISVFNTADEKLSVTRVFV